jgi:uncharacterized RDD family membrane protein YckC
MDTIKWWKDKLDKALAPRARKPKFPSPYATFYERLMAAALDMTALFFLLGRSLQAISKQVYGQLTPEQSAVLSQAHAPADIYYHAIETGFISLWLINFSLQILLIGVAYVGFQILFKTTPGKWIMGLKITTRDNQTFPPIWRLLLRYAGYAASCAPLMLGVVWMNVDKQSRAWHDWIAGTRVITTRPQGWYWGKIKQGFYWLKHHILSRIK